MDEAGARIVEQHGQEIGRSVERTVCNETERLTGQPNTGGVTFDDLDVGPATTERRCPLSIQLHGEHTARDVRELRRQPAATSAEIKDQIVRPNAGVADELSR